MRGCPSVKHARFRMDSNTMLTHGKLHVVVGDNGNAMSAEMKRKLLDYNEGNAALSVCFALRVDIWLWDTDKIHAACANIRTSIDPMARTRCTLTLRGLLIW